MPQRTAPFALVSDKKLLNRGVKYSDFQKRMPLRIHSKGKIISGKKRNQYWKDRSLTGIGKKFSGYRENELEINPSITLQETETLEQRMIDRIYIDSVKIRLSENAFSIVDFGVNLSGFIGAKITCDKKTTLFLVFDEILTENDVDFKRLGCINIVSYDLDPGGSAIRNI